MDWNCIGQVERFNISENATVHEKTISKLIPAADNVLSDTDRALLDKSSGMYEPEYALYTLQIAQTKHVVKTGLFAVLTTRAEGRKKLCFLRYLDTAVKPAMRAGSEDSARESTASTDETARYVRSSTDATWWFVQ
jgi:hypothetical protein